MVIKYFIEYLTYNINNRFTWTKDIPLGVHDKRHSKGGGIMVWGILFPNGLISLKVVNGWLKGDDYLEIVKFHAVPLMKMNINHPINFIHDNCTIHKVQSVRECLKVNNIHEINWPSRSPDLNIMENAWKMLSDIVYHDGQPESLQILKERILRAETIINTEKRNIIKNLYSTFRKRLVYVLNKKGSVYK